MHRFIHSWASRRGSEGRSSTDFSTWFERIIKRKSTSWNMIECSDIKGIVKYLNSFVYYLYVNMIEKSIDQVGLTETGLQVTTIRCGQRRPSSLPDCFKQLHLMQHSKNSKTKFIIIVFTWIFIIDFNWLKIARLPSCSKNFFLIFRKSSNKSFQWQTLNSKLNSTRLSESKFEF